MKNRFFAISCLFVALTCCMPQNIEAFSWPKFSFWPFKKKNKTEKKEELTPYQKLFKDKKTETVHGLMTVHKVNDKIYVEFPVDMLGREMLLTSVIENTSDAGEGVPGQLGGRDVRLRFEMIDSTIVARMPLLSKPVNTSGNANISKALDKSHNPGIFKSFKILACSPDSSALVVDMKSLFLDGSSYTKPFPSSSANGYYGFVTRTHTLSSEKSSILGISASDAEIFVREELCYSVDHSLMGMGFMYENVPLTAVVHKILRLLPETPMRPRIADSRLGMTTQLKSDFVGVGEEVKDVRYAKRWRIEPSDSVAFSRGEIVVPKKKLVFYVDSLIPSKWFPYIEKGAESWNKVFEKIGFKDVISVAKFPENDSAFNALSFDVQTIRYAPSWMNSAQVSLHTDVRTGEILNASILMNANLISVQYSDRIAATAAVDPRVCAEVFPQDVQGEMIQAAIAQAVGVGLGLTPNPGAVSAYPVDSLRSVSFTREHGLAPSIMTELVLNSVATPEEVRNGVRLVNTTPGPYDELVVKYLYKPIDVKSWTDEKEVLDGWIRECSGKPEYAYICSQPSFPSDPREMRGALGNDHLKTLDYTLPNLRAAYDNYYSWYANGDADFTLRQYVRSALLGLLETRIQNIFSYIGGIYLNDVRANDVIPAYVMVDAEKQRAALHKGLELAKTIGWVDEDKHASEYEISDKWADKIRLSIFNGIFERLPFVEVCTEKFPEEAYTSSQYLDDVYNAVWEPTLSHRSPDDFEKTLQTAFLSSIIQTSSAVAPVGSFSVSASAYSFTGMSADMYLAGLREGKRPNRKLSGKAMAGEEISAFSPVRPVHANQTKIAAYYFDLLMRTKEMLEEAAASASGDDKSYYDLLLYRINKAIDID